MIPKSLKIQNFLSHDLSEIDFDKFNVALILGSYDDGDDQSNGAGKSAIFEAISWVLFGKSRHKKSDGVVKWDRRSCRVEFTFLVDDGLYKIIRTRDKIVRDSDVVFKRWDNNTSEFKSIDCDTNTATDRKIISIINVNYDVFINSVYFKQDDISMFATATPSKRKDVIKSLLKMEKWDAYQKKTKDYVKSLNAKIEEKSQNLIPMIKLENELNECKLSVSKTKGQIKDSNKIFNEFNSKLIAAKSDYQSIYSGVDKGEANRLKILQKEFTSAKKRVSAIKLQKETNNKTVNNNTNQIASFQQKIRILNDQIKNGKKISIDKLRTRMVDGRTKERLLAEQVSELKKEIKFAEACDRCKRPLTKKEIISLKKQCSDELAVAQKKYNDTKVKIISAAKILRDREGTVATGNKAELGKGKVEIKISKLKNEIDACLGINERLIMESKSIKGRDYKKEIGELKLKFDKDNEEKLQTEIIKFEKNVSEVKRRVDRLNVEYGSKIRRRNEITKIQKDQLALQKEIDKLSGEYAVYDKLRSYFGKDGIQSVIIENVIEELENYSNETLSKICNEPTSISIRTQKQNDNGSWAETFDIMVKAGSRTDDFDTFSGGEKFRISLALRLALSNILSKRMGGVLKFLLLDEVSSNLDNKGLDMFIDIIKQLGQDLKILVITHNERLKERFENIIIVNKGPNGSQARFQ